MAFGFGSQNTGGFDSLISTYNKKKKAPAPYTQTVTGGSKSGSPSFNFNENPTFAPPPAPPASPVSDPGIQNFGQPYNGILTGGSEGGASQQGGTVPDMTFDIKYIQQADLANLGLDESYIGLPYSVGYYDESGKWVEVRNALEAAKQLHDLRELQAPDIIQLQQTPEYQALTDLISQLNNPATTAQDYQQGESYLDQLLGLNPGGYSQTLGGINTQLGQGISGQQGLSQQERDIYNRQTQVQLQQMQEDSKMLLESLGASGRSTAGYKAMLDISRGMADFQSQRQLELVSQDMMMKQAEYDALKNRFDSLFQAGNVTIGQYTAALRENRINALQGYAQQLSAIAQQNQTNIAAYEAHAQVTYQTIMADLGLSEGLLNEAQGYFEMYMAPTLAQMQQDALQSQVDANNNQTILDWVGLGVSVVFGIIGFLL